MQSAASGTLRSVWDEVGGVRVHGRVSATASASALPPLVFVHGLGVSTRYMEPTMAVLAREHRVAGLDLPGFGRSGSPSRVLDLAGLADALAAWIDARGIGPAVLVGNSFGCQVITECATRSPSRVLGLVLNAPTIDPAHRTILAMVARVIADIPREPLSLAMIVARDYLRAGPRRLFTTLRVAIADRIEEKLVRITVPVSVVAAERDPVVTLSWADEVAQLVGRERPGAAGGRLHVVPRIAHALPYDAPDTFAALVLELATRAQAAGSTT